ncbi:MAG TPA: hypothetical protein VFA22_01000 [Stellaceae bacterium]|nr:hypothetical protein [Stellaceae bacterium]
MTSRISLLSAALAVGALVALPALAETPSPASNVQASVDAKTDVKRDAHKVTKSKKPHEQTAAKPGSTAREHGKTGDETAPAKP